WSAPTAANRSCAASSASRRNGTTTGRPCSCARSRRSATTPIAPGRALAALDDAGFIALAQRRFGWRLGRLGRPGRRHPYAIHRVAAGQLTAPRAVLVGNAAQTIHPIGAQGFNLGLRDALTLAELVAAAGDPGDAALLARYAARRAPDREATMAMSHGLVQLACRGMGFRGEPPLAVLERLP